MMAKQINPKFDERYDIRLATMADVDAIMSYFNEHWKKGHIMSLDRDLFLYEYGNGDNINFVLAIDKATKTIEAIRGFIYCSNPNGLVNADKLDIWGSVWHVNTTRENMGFLGVELELRANLYTKCRRKISFGVNPKTTAPLRKLWFGDKVIQMNQYYLLNPDVSEFKIAVINERNERLESKVSESSLISLATIASVRDVFDVDDIDSIPYKDSWYVEKRFFNHPYYDYTVYGVQSDSGVVEALLVTRIVEANKGRALRIVDYFGNHSFFGGLQKELIQLMRETNCEYIDLVTYGFDEDKLLEAGFHHRTKNDPNIIPHYFEPFVQKNVDIWGCHRDENTVFFKADGDQDRPNIYRQHN